MSNPRHAGVVALLALCFGVTGTVALAAPRPHKVLPNIITRGFFTADARQRTVRLEQDYNGLLTAQESHDAALHGRKPLYSPIILSQKDTTFTAPGGAVAAVSVSTLGSTDLGRGYITSIYTFTYDARTGILLQQSAVPAPTDVIQRYHFPSSTFSKKSHP